MRKHQVYLRVYGQPRNRYLYIPKTETRVVQKNDVIKSLTLLFF